MKKKYLYNQKNKEELIKILENEKFKRATVSFYKYVELNNLENLRDDLFISWNKLNILGRVYIAKEGINAQISIPEKNLSKFQSKLSLNKVNACTKNVEERFCLEFAGGLVRSL